MHCVQCESFMDVMENLLNLVEYLFHRCQLICPNSRKHNLILYYLIMLSPMRLVIRVVITWVTRRMSMVAEELLIFLKYTSSHGCNVGFVLNLLFSIKCCFEFFTPFRLSFLSWRYKLLFVSLWYLPSNLY